MDNIATKTLHKVNTTEPHKVTQIDHVRPPAKLFPKHLSVADAEVEDVMAANPRKFSEKIALMRAKEAEGDAAFNQILTEVSGITRTTETEDGFNATKVSWSPSRLKQLHIPAYSGLKNLIHHGAPYAQFKTGTGSLPNINHSLQQQQQQMQQQQHRQHSPGQQMSPHSGQIQPPQPMSVGPMGGSGIDLKSAIHDLNSLNGSDTNRRRFPVYGVGGGGAPGMRPQRSRTNDHVSYSPYLTPHPLNGPEWKKFKSDSDIHGSIKHQPPTSSGGSSGGVISPMIHRRVLEMGGHPNQMSVDMRSSGNSGLGKVPEGSSFPPNGMSPMHLSMGSHGALPTHQMLMLHPSQQNHHGSLPDLSILGFNHNTSPSSHPHTAPNSNHGPCSPPNDGFGRMVSTSMPPPDSPSSMRPNGSRQQSPLIGSPTQIKHMQGMPHFQYFPQPAVPMHITGLSMPGGGPSPAHLSNTNTMSHSIPLQHQQQQNKPQTNLDKQLVNETIRRYINDKQQAQQYRQNSESVPSPSSPSTPPPIMSPESSSQHGGGGGDNSSINYALSPGSHSALQQQFDQVKMEPPSVTASMNSNQYINGNALDSPFIHDHKPPVKQHSIPNIVLTGVDDNYGQYYFDKEFRPTMSMSDSFDASEMFGGDETFKSDLTPLDLEGLQMLDDPSNALTDPNTEDQLRLS